MKKVISILGLLVFLNVMGMSKARAQNSRYAPESGHWQLVYNMHQKQNVTVQFYNDKNELTHQETLDSKVNIHKTKIRKQLYFALKEANELYAANKKVPMLKSLMAKQH